MPGCLMEPISEVLWDLLCPRPRGHREPGEQRGKPPSQLWAFLPRLPAIPLPSSPSCLQQPQGRSEGGIQVPEMRPWPGSWQPTQLQSDKGRSRKEGALTKPLAAFISIYQHSFFPPFATCPSRGYGT